VSTPKSVDTTSHNRSHHRSASIRSAIDAYLQLVGLAIFIVWLIVFIGAFCGKQIKLPVIGDLAVHQAER
jgi:uncharacterized membrane protein